MARTTKARPSSVVHTPYGDFTITRKGTLAISVVRAKHRVCHHRKWLDEGELTHVEHRKLPTSQLAWYLRRMQCAMGWGQHLATFDLNGTMIDTGKSDDNNDNRPSGSGPQGRRGDGPTDGGTE